MDIVLVQFKLKIHTNYKVILKPKTTKNKYFLDFDLKK